MKLGGAAVIVVFLAGCGSGAEEERFARVGSYLTGAHPVTSAITDIDGDGDLDVIAPALISEDVVALINHDGELEWRQLTPLAYGASFALVIDAIGDEREELVISSRENDRVAIYEFVAGPDLALAMELEVRGATGLEAADLDGDGDDDLIVTCFNDQAVALFERTADGLEAAGELDTAAGPYRAEAADIDGDGLAEIVVVAAAGDRLELFRGQLGSGFELGAELETGDWPSSVEIGDRDGDGAIDIYATTNQGDSIFEVLVDTSGEPWTATSEPIDSGDGAFALATLGSELVVTNKEASAVAIYGETAQGELELREEFSTGVEAGPSPVYVWDLDGDGSDDLLVVNAFTDEVVVYRGR